MDLYRINYALIRLYIVLLLSHLAFAVLVLLLYGWDKEVIWMVYVRRLNNKKGRFVGFSGRSVNLVMLLEMC